MTTEQIMEKFFDGAVKGKASSLRIEDDKLFNYQTVIAQRVNGVIVINVTKYSRTTTVHQNRLTRALYNAKTIDDVPKGCQDLTRYL